MQIFVLRTELSNTNPLVTATYDDSPVMDRAMLGTQYALLQMDPTAVQGDVSTRLKTLVGDWRTKFVSAVVNNEAQRRIYESFSQFMQNNALERVLNNVLRYGAVTTTWPSAEQDMAAAAAQGWTYVNTIRAASDAMVQAMPVDPTADGNWPPRIPLVYIPHA